MPAITYKCPNCGGELKFDPATQQYRCEYCISSFSQEALENANPQPQQTQAQEREQTDENGAVVYSCPSCGAQIVADETTAATFCYYCHNPVILQGRLSGDYRPDSVIPFAVDKKEAVESFLAYVKSRRFVPKDFFCKEQIEKISGVYFPFWQYSCRADGCWRGQGNQIRVYRMGEIEYTETKVFAIEREADIVFTNLMRDALSKENRQLVEAVQPFRVEEAKPFSMGYLSGFLAEKRDMEKQELGAELKEEVRRNAQQMLRASVDGYIAATGEAEELHVSEETWNYLLLPVWVLTYRGKNGKLYYYAMNGQTKKVCGVLPLAKERVAALFAGIFLSVLFLMMMGGYFLW